MRAKLRPVLVALLPVLLAGGLAGCGPDSDTETAAGGPKIVIASLDADSVGFSDTEDDVLAHLYGRALEDAGANVKYRLRLGSRGAVVSALEKGEIDLVPEYLGGVLGHLDSSQAQGRSTPQALQALRVAAAPKGITVAEASPAVDGQVLAVTKELARDSALRKLSDLSSLPGPLTLAAPAECATSEGCLLGLRGAYGLDIALTTTGPDVGGRAAKKALQDGSAQVGRLFSSDPAVNKGGKYVVLEEDLVLQPPANVVPVIRTPKATPAILKVVNEVSKALTTAKLAALNEKTDKDRKAPAAVADAFVAAEKL